MNVNKIMSDKEREDALRMFRFCLGIQTPEDELIEAQILLEELNRWSQPMSKEAVAKCKRHEEFLKSLDRGRQTRRNEEARKAEIVRRINEEMAAIDRRERRAKMMESEGE